MRFDEKLPRVIEKFVAIPYFPILEAGMDSSIILVTQRVKIPVHSP